MGLSARALILAAGMLLAGCGSSAHRAADPSGATALAATAKACLYTSPHTAPTAGLPLDLLPAATLVTENTRQAASLFARAFVGRSVSDAHDEIVDKARRGGWKLSRNDNEGFEAEVNASRGAIMVTIRLVQVQRCKASSQGLIVVTGA